MWGARRRTELRGTSGLDKDVSFALSALGSLRKVLEGAVRCSTILLSSVGGRMRQEWSLESDLLLLLLILPLCRVAPRPPWGLKVPCGILPWSQGETFCTAPSHPELETPCGGPHQKGSHGLGFNSTSAVGHAPPGQPGSAPSGSDGGTVLPYFKSESSLPVQPRPLRGVNIPVLLTAPHRSWSPGSLFAPCSIFYLPFLSCVMQAPGTGMCER